MIVVVSLLVYPLFFNILGGVGLASGAAENYSGSIIEYSTFRLYSDLGAAMILSSVIMTLATVLYFRNKFRAALAADAAGIVICLAVLAVLRKTAAENGLTNEVFKPYADIYTERHLPTIIHPVALAARILYEYFSDSVHSDKISKCKNM